MTKKVRLSLGIIMTVTCVYANYNLHAVVRKSSEDKVTKEIYALIKNVSPSMSYWRCQRLAHAIVTVKNLKGLWDKRRKSSVRFSSITPSKKQTNVICHVDWESIVTSKKKYNLICNWDPKGKYWSHTYKKESCYKSLGNNQKIKRVDSSH
jgi:hypothetical protein